VHHDALQQRKPIVFGDTRYIVKAMKGEAMATIVKHRKVNIVFLDADEQISDHCRPGDIAIVVSGEGWWTSFVGRDGAIDRYDVPYTSYNAALWAAKAAAEYGTL
jgi:hypothetical protein